MSLESKGQNLADSSRRSDSIITAIFESRPDETLLSSDLLRSLYSPDCSDKEAEDRAYRVLLPLIKRQVSLFKDNPHLEADGEFRIACAVCPQPRFFRGWSALHIHAQKYWKSFPHQHQGYFKALSEVLQAERVPYLAVSTATDGLAWPPVLLVDNGAGKSTFDGSLRRWKGLHGTDVPGTLHDMDLEEVLVVYKKGRGDDRQVVVYPASEIGVLDADKLVDVLDQNPLLESCLKVQVLKDESQLKSNTAGNSCVEDGQDGHKIQWSENNKDQSLGSSRSNFDHEKNPPLETWQSLKEIRDSGRVDSIISKWAKGLSIEKKQCFAYKWPFQKSRKLRDMDAKFQKSLHKHRTSSATGSEKLKVQLDGIEKQLKKERLLWLKEISAVREQFEDAKKDIAYKEAQKALDRRLVQVNLEKAMDGNSDDELEELFANRLRQAHAVNRKRQQRLQDKERRRELLLQGWRFEANRFWKQAELAKEERHCITKCLQHDKMLDSISRVLEVCECCNQGNKVKEPECQPQVCKE